MKMKFIADAGESVMPKRGSNLASQDLDSHSGWVARRSDLYHKNTIDGTRVRHSEMKMTRAEQPRGKINLAGSEQDE
jgi:hypothetical protein